MKKTLNMMMLAFVAVSVNVHAVPQAPSAPLPQFMDKEQLAQWSASQAATAKVASSSQEASAQFYTGKPYVADVDGYIFKYRTYNPEMARWTSADPSGFPDGANNFVYAKNKASYSLDGTGLATLVSGPISNSTTATSTSNNPSVVGGFGSLAIAFSAGDSGGGVTGAGVDFPGSYTYTDSSGTTTLTTPYASEAVNGNNIFTVSGGGGGPGASAPTFSGNNATYNSTSGLIGFTVNFSASTTTNADGYNELIVTTTITGIYEEMLIGTGVITLTSSGSSFPTVTLTDIYE